ncbi:MAG: hypothetical protein KC621_22565, partial [Myxococcales bacterium]|nr:hypothetical protein [Myxococcales bacterium]
IGEHVNACMALAEGELIVGSAGDDVSLPHRVQRLYEAWLASGKTAFSMDSLYELVDENGVAVGTPTPAPLAEGDQLAAFSKTLTACVVGACHAWHRSVFDRFGPLPAITLEDVALPPRSMLLGRVIRVPEVLVRYRTHSQSVWNSWRNDRTGEQVLARRKFYAVDRKRASDDVVRCVEQVLAEETDAGRRERLTTIVARIRESQQELVLLADMLSEPRGPRWRALARYVSRFGLGRVDKGLLVASVSRTTYLRGRAARQALRR